jgi:hypothetical protein
MSTKIYTAWRCSVWTFEQDFVPAFRKHCMKQVVARVKKLAAAVKDERLKEIYETKGWAKEHTYDQFLALKEDFIRVREVFREAAKASKKLERDVLFCLDCSFNVWFNNHKAYIIPYGEHWITEGFKPPKGVEDYAYWNNTDKPDELTDRQWAARKRKWDEVCLNSWDATRLVHQIINAGDNIGLYEIATSVMPKKDVMGVTVGLLWEDRDAKKREKSPGEEA